MTERGDTINSFRYEDIGVNLTVTPKISPDGFVKLDLGTTNSSLGSSDVKINASATVPVINQRRANTTVSVQNGQTIIIGGLETVRRANPSETARVQRAVDMALQGAQRAAQGRPAPRLPRAPPPPRPAVGHGFTTTGALGASPNISGAYMASIRVCGRPKVPGLLRRTVYSTWKRPFGR